MPRTDLGKTDMKKFVLLLFLTFGLTSIGQNKNNNIRRGQYFSLQAALSVNPDSVFDLHLGNLNLKDFPQEILKFKNLESVSFNDNTIIEIYEYGDSSLLSLKDRNWVRKKLKKLNYPDRIEAIRAPIRNENKLSVFPDSITQLKNLKQISLSRGQTSRRKIKRLKKLLPACEIYVEWQYLFH